MLLSPSRFHMQCVLLEFSVKNSRTQPQKRGPDRAFLAQVGESTSFSQEVPFSGPVFLLGRMVLLSRSNPSCVWWCLRFLFFTIICFDYIFKNCDIHEDFYYDDHDKRKDDHIYDCSSFPECGVSMFVLKGFVLLLLSFFQKLFSQCFSFPFFSYFFCFIFLSVVCQINPKSLVLHPPFPLPMTRGFPQRIKEEGYGFDLCGFASTGIGEREWMEHRDVIWFVDNYCSRVCRARSEQVRVRGHSSTSCSCVATSASGVGTSSLGRTGATALPKRLHGTPVGSPMGPRAKAGGVLVFSLVLKRHGWPPWKRLRAWAQPLFEALAECGAAGYPPSVVPHLLSSHLMVSHTGKVLCPTWPWSQQDCAASEFRSWCRLEQRWPAFKRNPHQEQRWRAAPRLEGSLVTAEGPLWHRRLAEKTQE